MRGQKASKDVEVGFGNTRATARSGGTSDGSEAASTVATQTRTDGIVLCIAQVNVLEDDEQDLDQKGEQTSPWSSSLGFIGGTTS